MSAGHLMAQNTAAEVISIAVSASNFRYNNYWLGKGGDLTSQGRKDAVYVNLR
jgi:hypothetical protein